MFAPRLVFIGNDDDIGAAQCFAVAVAPFASAHRAARRGEFALNQRLNILFALDNEDGQASRNVADDLRQAIENRFNAFQLPDPAAFAVGLTLAKVLWRETHSLE